jgi:hypothetical protein
MLSRYPQHLTLWELYIEYCKKSSSAKQLGRIIPKGLAHHSRSPVLWVTAASWEFGENNNILTARTLMQRALRFCANEKVVWLEYFRLELLYVQKLRMRGAFLGLLPDETEQRYSLGELPPAAGGDTNPMDEELQSSSTHKNVPFLQFITELPVPRAVIRNALRQFPSDIDLRREILQIYHEYPGTLVGMEDVFLDLQALAVEQGAAAVLLLQRPYFQHFGETVPINVVSQVCRDMQDALQSGRTKDSYPYSQSFASSLWMAIHTFVSHTLPTVTRENENEPFQLQILSMWQSLATCPLDLDDGTARMQQSLRLSCGQATPSPGAGCQWKGPSTQWAEGLLEDWCGGNHHSFAVHEEEQRGKRKGGESESESESESEREAQRPVWLTQVLRAVRIPHPESATTRSVLVLAALIRLAMGENPKHRRLFRQCWQTCLPLTDVWSWEVTRLVLSVEQQEVDCSLSILREIVAAGLQGPAQNHPAMWKAAEGLESKHGQLERASALHRRMLQHFAD